MADLSVPVIRFSCADDCTKGTAMLLDQQFDVHPESDLEISCRPWDDLDEAIRVLEADGFACQKGWRAVARLGPGKPSPHP